MMLDGFLIAKKLNRSVGDIVRKTDRTNVSALPISAPEHGTIGMHTIVATARKRWVKVP
jgi:hypothetical protein